MITTSKSANTNKETREKKLLATLFAVAALSLLYFYVMAIIRPSVSPLIGSSGAGISQSDMAISGDTAGTSKYGSESMKIEFDYPMSYQIDESTNSIKLYNSKGYVEIDRQGVSYDKIDDYLEYFLTNRKNIISQGVMKLGENNVASVLLKQDDGANQKILIMVNNGVRITISTTVEILQTDLDVIAKSLRFVE